MSFRNQYTYLKFCPLHGTLGTPVSLACNFRWAFPKSIWRFNPWTGSPRDKHDIETDPFGMLIVPPNEILEAAK